MQQYQRMADPAIQALYKKRSQIAEFAKLKIKAAWKLDQFRVRGLAKVSKEAFWMVLAFTVDRWFALQRHGASQAIMAAA